MPTLEDKCIFKEDASEVLKHAKMSASNYMNRGCYYCQGFNKKCEYYVPVKQVKTGVGLDGLR